MSVAALAPAPTAPDLADEPSRPAAPTPRLLRAIPTDPPREDEPGGTVAMATCGAPVLPFALHPSPLPPLTHDTFHAAWPTPPLARPERASHATRRTCIDDELDEIFGPQPTPRSALPDPGPRAAAAVRVLLEVMVGDRPAYQVAEWVSPALLTSLERRCPAGAPRQARRPLLRSLHVSEPAESVAEVAAVISNGPRCRAVALRLEGMDGRWTVTALRVG